jgi:hypothetical protein
MSPAGRALHEKFEEVSRSELQRLRKKTASLSPEQRAEVDALSVEIAKRIASRLDAALEHPDGSTLVPVVMELFAVAPGTGNPISH